MPDTAQPETQKPDLGHLPEWNLADLYKGIDDPAINADLDRIRTSAEAFASKYKGKLAEISGDELGAAIAAYEADLEILYKIMSFGQLLYASDLENQDVAGFYQTVQERVNEISTITLFFTLELNRIEDDRLEAQFAGSAALMRYRPWVDEVRVFRPHQLSDEAERLLHEKSVTGKSAWVRLFEETMAGLRFDVEGEGEPMTLSGALNLSFEKDGSRRKNAAHAVGKTLGDNARLVALITNTLAKDKEIEDGWRKYAHPMAKRNMANQVEDEVVTALVDAVTDNYENLAHRYYKLKAKWFGADVLDYWDRNAPLPDDSNKLYTWDEARSTVLDAYGAFVPDMADIARKFFDDRWIDAPPRPGKDSGAFSHSTVPSVHPYILMNFHGKARDVMTLAHELGHGVHQVLAGPQGTLMADTPLTLAETASVFGEMLTFQAMLKAETDPARRRILLAGKVEDMMNTVVRQIAFHQFEAKVHGERPKGELPVERLCEIWMEVQTDSLGPAFRYDDHYKYFWTYIGHFIHTPFYVYAYAFGDCLVNSLYDVFQQGHEGFQGKYLDMLRAGGTRRHKELLAPFGLDASDPAFWQRGLSVISGFVDELEADL